MPRSLDFEYLLTPNGLETHRRVEIDDTGRVAGISKTPGDRFDAHFAVPGMPNAHSHAFQRAMVGHGEAKSGKDSFWSWRQHMYGLANIIGPDDLYAIARRAYTDMLCAGFTSVGEFHYLHHLPAGEASDEMGRAVIAAAQDVGIRLVFLPVYYRTGGFGAQALPEQRRFIHASPETFCELLAQFADIHCGIAPHSLRAVPADELQRLVEMAESVLGKNFPIHMHIAEQEAEVEQCEAFHKARPLKVLSDSVNLDRRWNLVHATHINGGECSLITASGARVVLCPLTEAYLGDGFFPAPDFQKMGGHFAVGSDSNVRIDAIEELRLLEYGQRLKHRQRACLANDSGIGQPLWQHCATSGAAALALAAGEIRTGSYADFVTLDTGSSSLSGIAPENLLDAWLTAGSRQNIRDVYVGGECMVRDGEALSEAEVGRDYTRCMAGLHAVMKAGAS